MCPKAGRPPKMGVTRNKKITFRITDEDLLRLGKCAEKLGKSRADTVLYGIHLIEAELKKK